MNDVMNDVESPFEPGSRASEQLNRYLERRNRRLARAANAEKAERNKKAAAWVEAAVVKAIETPYDDPDFERALHIVAHAVKEMLSPTAIGYLEATLDDDARAGAIRWRELARLNLWLSRAALPIGRNAKKLVKEVGFTGSNAYRLTQAQAHPHRLFFLSPRVPGRTLAAIYKIARRAKVSPNTVACALFNFGLERLTDALRQSKEVPPTLTAEQRQLYPVQGETK